MPDTEEPWQVVARVAGQITPDQVAEIVAGKRFAMAGARCPIMARHRDGPTIGPLIALGVVTWGKPPRGSGFGPKGWGVPLLTPFGERVLLHIAERAMLATGAMAADGTEIEDHA